MLYLLFFLFLSVTCIVLAVTLLASLFISGVELQALYVLAVITGVMSCFYGIHWVYNVLKQRFMDKWFSDDEEEEEKDAEGVDDGEEAEAVTKEYVLPREQLVAAADAGYRGIYICIWTVYFLAVLAAAGILSYLGALKNASQLLHLIASCVLLSVPCIVIHLLIKARNKRSVPGKIALAPGLLIADGTTFKAKDLESVKLSVRQTRSKRNASVFRQLEIFTEDDRQRFIIDHAPVPEDGMEISWNSSEDLASSLSEWGNASGVTVIRNDTV